MRLTGSICLTDIPQECMVSRNGKVYLNILVGANKEPLYNKNGEVYADHYIKVNVKREERREGVKYYIGNLKKWENEDSGEVKDAFTKLIEDKSQESEIF